MEIKVKLKCPECRAKREFKEEGKYYKCSNCGYLVKDEAIKKKIELVRLTELIYHADLHNQSELKNILVKIINLKR